MGATPRIQMLERDEPDYRIYLVDEGQRGFIVRAVNAHDALVAALKGLALGHTPDWSWCDDGWLCEHPECIAARAALKLAGESV